MKTYANATLALPDGQRVKLDSFTWNDVERWPATVESPRPLSREFPIVSFKVSVREWRRIVRATTVRCWKCYDGRTRSHNRRCRYRGHGRRSEAI